MLRIELHRRTIAIGHLVLGAIALLVLCLAANASGPRYVTGPPYFTGAPGQPVAWAQGNVRYFTDPGDLSANVNHAAADAIVAAAAGVWNVPVASITVLKGGALAEHVSGRNVYLGSNGLVFPDDVQSTNAASIPIAVIYDSDGSVTDTLLGAGASLPSGCRQNAVTESVDGFDPAGYITHAILVVNGRCSGGAPQQQLELQYKLERAFGRVLGLAWSQLNDNVFTGSPQPSYAQALHWPILHPIEIVCGLYSYQCLPAPFQLRDDDIASLVLLYPVRAGNVPVGKQASLASADSIFGTLSFPTGEGMAGVNLLMRRQDSGTGYTQPYYDVSAVSGTTFRRAGTSPFVPSDSGVQNSQGSPGRNEQGFYRIAYVPLDPASSTQNLILTEEPVNPLYRGFYSLGPYAAGAVAPSGTLPALPVFYFIEPNRELYVNLPVTDAASLCGEGLDGTPAQPAQMPAGGTWNGLICGVGHASYVLLNIRAGRTFTAQATALDEHGQPTQAKLMPVLALANVSDEADTLPTLGVSPSAFQARTTGTTTITGQTPALPAQSTQIRLGIADQRGDGRPDYPYGARVLYADTITPAVLPMLGGSLHIQGIGFRPGVGVTIHGVRANVASVDATQLTVTAPPIQAVALQDGEAADVTVFDPATGATSTVSAGVTYTDSPTQPNLMMLLKAPQGWIDVGVDAPDPFTVQVLKADGVTPVAGELVRFTSTAGNVHFGACGAASCNVVTDAQGLATTSVAPSSAGAVSLVATSGNLQQTVTLAALPRAFSMAILKAPTGDFDVGVQAFEPFVVRVYGADGVSGIPGRRIVYTVISGQATFSGCSAPTCAFTADATGAAVVFVTLLSKGSKPALQA